MRTLLDAISHAFSSYRTESVEAEVHFYWRGSCPAAKDLENAIHRAHDASPWKDGNTP